MIPSAAASGNNTSGNGQFGSLLRKRTKKNAASTPDDFNYLDKNDVRMRFNNAQDPIYYVFNVIENRPLKTIAKEFVKDSFFEIANFVSRAAK